MPQARRHLRQVYTHIARDSIGIAQQVTNDLVERTRLLNEFPLTGKIIPEAGDENLREVHEHNWRIFLPSTQPRCVRIRRHAQT